MLKPRLERDGVVAAEQVDDLDVERPPSPGTLVGGAHVDPGVARQPGGVQVLDPAVVDRVLQVAGRIGGGHESAAVVLDRGRPQPQGRRVGEAAGEAQRRGEVPAAGQPVAPDRVERVGPVVLERVAAAVARALGTSPRVRHPSREPRGGVPVGQEDIEPPRVAARVVGGGADDDGGGGHALAQGLGKVVARDPRRPLRLGLQPADEEVVEPLVVPLDPGGQVGAEVLLDAQHEVGGPFVAQPQLAGARQVDEVVGLGQLLVPGALRVQPARRPEARPAPEGVARGQPRRDGGAAVDGAPVEPQAGLERCALGRRPGVLQPQAAARAVQDGIEVVGQPRAPLHARRVRLRVVAVAGDQPPVAGLQAVHLDAGAQQVPRRDLHAQVLPQRAVGHDDGALERDGRAGERDLVVGGVGPRGVGANLTVEA